MLYLMQPYFTMLNYTNMFVKFRVAWLNALFFFQGVPALSASLALVPALDILVALSFRNFMSVI